jgi:zinc transport system permease protein
VIEAPPTWADLAMALEVFRDPILAGAIAGATLGYLGVFVLLRRMVFVTAALAQASGLGVALAFWLGIHLDLHPWPGTGALIAALAAALALSVDLRRLHLSREGALAGVWLVGSAGAVLVGSRITQDAHDVSAILFGSAVVVQPHELWTIAALGALTLGLGVMGQRALVFTGFDPDGARVQGLPVRWIELGFLAVLTGVVSVTTRALGALPVLAFAVLPGAAGLLAAPRLPLAFPLAAALGAVAGAAGYLAAFVLDLPVGATQAAVALLFVAAAAPVALLRG